MTVTLALAGDTMLGRGVAERLRQSPRAPLLDPALVESSAPPMRSPAESGVLCLGSRGTDPRAGQTVLPPRAAGGGGAPCRARGGVRDAGQQPRARLRAGCARPTTLEHLAAAGVACVGAGPDRDAARRPVGLAVRDRRVRVVATADHPASYAAGRDRPGIAFADLTRSGVPEWLREAARPLAGEIVLVSVHRGPNMTPVPVPHVRAAAAALEAAGATLVAGHSAHVPHGARGRVLFDLGDFLDDYAVNPLLRNDLSLLWLVTVDADGPRRVEGVPVRLEYTSTGPADERETRELAGLMADRCATVGSRVEVVGGRLVFSQLSHALCRGVDDGGSS